MDRTRKLIKERRSIEAYRSSARNFALGEEGALSDDIVALMVLRHYGVPTRLLDWSASPFVAAYFASHEHGSKDGEIWSFDQSRYESEGRKQWRRWPETTLDGSGQPTKFDAKLTAFAEDPPDWFVCGFYSGFPRQHAQMGAYSMTARFNVDHSKAISALLGSQGYERYVIKGAIKSQLLELLREHHGIWRGSLFPDSAGAAEIAREVFFTQQSGSMHG